MKPTKTLTARYQRDDAGAWLVRVVEIPGCHTYGRSLRQARARLREALGLWIEEGDDVQLVEDLRLPAPARAALRRFRSARAKAERVRRDADAATADAIRALVEAEGLSVRDAGDLLGLSHQRVAQLTGER